MERGIVDEKFVSQDTAKVLKLLKTSEKGLSRPEAAARLSEYGLNDPTKRKENHVIIQFLAGFMNPLVLALLAIAVFSFVFGEKISAILVAVMAFASVLIGFIQEYRAKKTAEKLIDMVKVTSNVFRDGRVMSVKMSEVVPGDIVNMVAGDMIPADLRIIQAKDLFINQSTFTGESFPVEKFAAGLDKVKMQLASLNNIALMGSSVVSGTALGVIIQTGLNTELGRMSVELQSGELPTTFDKGIRSFTLLMLRYMLILAFAVFIINASFKGNWMEAFLFALAVAVGLAPEMLPMEVTINLSKGAIAMSKKDIIVKRLDSIQNLGAMDILCTDKTGTLTLDEITLVKHINALAEDDEDVLHLAFLNSYYQTGLHSVLDKAVLKHQHMGVKDYKKVDEIPFDFERRVMSVVVAMDHRRRIITKGAPEQFLSRCDRYEVGGKISKITKPMMARLDKEYDLLSAQGYRVLAIGYNDFPATRKTFSYDDERGLIFKGFVAFLDPAKPTVEHTIKALEKLGIKLKILSGDNDLVTKKVCMDVNLTIEGILKGEEIEKMSDAELQKKVDGVTIFARVSPLQKERIIFALRANRHAVGFLGDGINDALALKAADVGISVNNAVGVAKETADIILLKKSLSVLKDCVIEGRKTFGNIIKYIKMGASSNFGNMFSMTGASLFLPFLPMRPIQILFNNFLYDLSQISLPTDQVDQEYINNPRPWNIDLIKKFMIVIGPVSSLFDYITFAVMWFVFQANTPAQQALFSTGWFLESLASQTLVIYVIRTNGIPFIHSRPSKPLVFTTLAVLVCAFIFANSAIGGYMNFTPLPLLYFVILFFMLAAYLGLVQLVKQWFIKKYGYV
jgi:P-type Mg2+ transporter